MQIDASRWPKRSETQVEHQFSQDLKISLLLFKSMTCPNAACELVVLGSPFLFIYSSVT